MIKKNLFITILLIHSFVYANDTISLKGLTKTTNISTNSVDIKEVLELTNKQMKLIDFSKLKKDVKTIDIHKKKISKIQDNLKLLSSYRSELEIANIDLKQLEDDLLKAKKQYDRGINKIYRKNKQIDRYSYIMVASKGDLDYKKDLENFIIDKYAIKQYDQTTTLEKSLLSASMQSVIKTQKDFGQKSVDRVYDYIFRENGVTFKVFKITQNPFIKSAPKVKTNRIETSNDTLVESKVSVYDLSSQEFGVLQEMLQVKFNISFEDIEPFMKNLNKKVDIAKQLKNFDKSTKKITTVLKALEVKHNKELEKIANLQNNYLTKKEFLKILKPKLNNLLVKTQKELKSYGIPLTKESIGNISILTPKTYDEIVDYNEELEYINRKVKSYISKVNVADLEQSDTLIDFEDLTSTTKNKQKAVKFETIHILPFLSTNNKIGLFLFSSISIKDELTEDDLLSFDLKYETLKFIPIKKGYKTLFVAQKEITLGVVNEFLETNNPKRYFDQYCIDNSYLPEEAKDFKNIDEEFYNYPAICFKVDKIDGFIKWLSKKTKRDIVIPQTEDWSFVATNLDTTDYCWGNQTPEELIDEEIVPENIYLDEIHADSSIEEVAKFPKSKSGIYDMCGNVFEFTMQDGELAYKGNSFSSYIELSSGEGEYYSDEVNPSLGLRVFYIKDLTNE